MIKRYQKDEDLKQAVTDVRRDGVVIIEDLFSPSVIDQLMAAAVMC